MNLGHWQKVPEVTHTLCFLYPGRGGGDSAHFALHVSVVEIEPSFALIRIINQVN